jgi:hypothetical protein
MSIVTLVIEGIDIPPYASRGAVEVLKPIEAATQVERTVNGRSIDISDPNFQKYGSVITCTDQQAPEFAWPGTIVTVDCLTFLSFRTATGYAERDAVDGSEYIDGVFTFYRPRLEMRVLTFSINRDDWQAITGWSLSLEEV